MTFPYSFLHHAYEYDEQFLGFLRPGKGDPQQKSPFILSVLFFRMRYISVVKTTSPDIIFCRSK